MIDLTGINGWFNFQHYYDSVFPKLRSGACVMEIGVYQGLSTFYFADLIRSSGKSIEFHCGDLFEIHPKTPASYSRDYPELFRANLERLKLGDYIHVHKGFSVDILDRFDDRYFDFIFIDGNHNCDPVFNDVSTSMRKLKSGGILSGHDQSWKTVQCGLLKAGIVWKVFSGDVWQADLTRLQ